MLISRRMMVGLMGGYFAASFGGVSYFMWPRGPRSAIAWSGKPHRTFYATYVVHHQIERPDPEVEGEMLYGWEEWKGELSEKQFMALRSIIQHSREFKPPPNPKGILWTYDLRTDFTAKFEIWMDNEPPVKLETSLSKYRFEVAQGDCQDLRVVDPERINGLYDELMEASRPRILGGEGLLSDE